jgi:DNA-binding MarR family transcriptional regulator
MYEMLAKRGYVDVKKMDGDKYITTTEKGDEISNQLLQELITSAQLSNIAPMMKEADLSHETYKVRKGVKGSFLRENANLKMAAEKLMEDIVEINSQFEEEMKDLEAES